MKDIAYRLLYGFNYLLSILPMRVLYVISDLIRFFMYYVVRYRRAIVRKNLHHSFPEMTPQDLKKTEKEFYKFFCDCVVENIRMLTMSEKEVKERMRIEGCDEMRRVFKEHDYVIVYLGHYCNWEYVASLPLWFDDGTKCAQIYSPLHSDAFDKLFYKIRSRHGSTNIKKSETLRHMLGFRQRGEKVVVGFISDQTPRWINIHKWVDFLNQDTPVFTGTERIAKKLNAGVFYANMERIDRGHYVCHMELMSDNPAQTEDGELTAMYMNLLQESIRKNPPYWLWTHNRWKRQRSDMPEEMKS